MIVTLSVVKRSLKPLRTYSLTIYHIEKQVSSRREAMTQKRNCNTDAVERQTP